MTYLASLYAELEALKVEAKRYEGHPDQEVMIADAIDKVEAAIFVETTK